MQVTVEQAFKPASGWEPTPWFGRRKRMKDKAQRITEAADKAFAAGDVERGERLDEAVFRLSSRW